MTTVTCVRCNREVNGKVRLCPSCGGEMPVVGRLLPACPRCACPLNPHEYRGVSVDRCPRCQGMWLDLRKFGHLASGREAFGAGAPVRMERRPPPRTEGGLPCAGCGRPMDSLNFKTILDVTVAVCSDCGYWLDAGELDLIRVFVAAGGLEKAQDRELIRHRTEIEALAGRLGGIDFMDKVLHRWDFLRWLFQGW